MTVSISPNDRFLTIKQVREIVPKDRSTIYRWIEKGLFPANHRIGPGSVAWLQSEVLEWAEKHARQNIPEPPS